MANAAFTFSIHGDKEIANLFRSLPDKMQRQVLRPILRHGAKMMLVDARNNLPKSPGRDREEDTGMLSRSLRVRVMNKLRRGSVGFVVEAPTIVATTNKKGKTVWKGKKRRDKSVYADNQRKFYANVQEAGNKKKTREPAPFMEPARKKNEAAIIALVRSGVSLTIDALGMSNPTQISR